MNRIQIRRGTTSEWAAANPVLASGEPGLDTTLNLFKVGDGVSPWTSLIPPYPLGVIGRPAVIQADQTGITALTDLTGFTQTMTVVAGRLYEVSWLLTTVQVTTGGAGQVVYASFDGAQAIIINNNPVAAGALTTYGGSAVFCGGTALGSLPNVAAGPGKVIKLRGQTSAGTMSIGSGSSNNGRFSIKDIGAAV